MAAEEVEELRQRLAESEDRASKAEEQRQKLRGSLVGAAAGLLWQIGQRVGVGAGKGYSGWSGGGAGQSWCSRAPQERAKAWQAHPCPFCHPPIQQALLKERALNTGQVVKRLKESQDSLAEARSGLAEEQRRREATEAAMERQLRDTAAAAAAATAAAAAAERAQQRAAAAEQRAAAAERAAVAARDEAVVVWRQLEAQRVQADRGGGVAAEQQQQQLGGPAVQELQQQVHELAAELHRWHASFAALVSGGSRTHLGSLPPPPPPAAARQQRPRQPRQRQGPTSPRAPQAAAAALPTAAGTMPPVEAAAQPPAEDARAKAVRQVAEQKAAAAGTAAAPSGGGGHRGPNKRGRPAAAANGPAAAANVLAEAFESMDGARGGAKRAKAAASAQHQGRGGGVAPAPAPTAPAAAAAAEASLAISANELPGGQEREQTPAADEAAQLLGSLTASAPPGGPDARQLERVAADLHLRLADKRLPLPLLLACFETAVLECAAPQPQPQHLRCGAGEQQEQREGGDGSAALASASPEHWFRVPGGAEAALQQGGPVGDVPPFVAVWCSREALAGHHLAWLLHCAVRIHRLERMRLAASAVAADAAAPRSEGSASGFAAALQRHLHQLVAGCCLAACGAAAAAALRHTETEVCALAAAAAGLCRVFGNVEVSGGSAGGWGEVRVVRQTGGVPSDRPGRCPVHTSFASTRTLPSLALFCAGPLGPDTRPGDLPRCARHSAASARRRRGRLAGGAGGSGRQQRRRRRGCVAEGGLRLPLCSAAPVRTGGGGSGCS